MSEPYFQPETASEKQSTENLGALHGLSAVPQKIRVQSEAKCHYAVDLPDEFVTYFSGRSRGMRYSRVAVDNWDEWIWHGEWVFSDNVGGLLGETL